MLESILKTGNFTQPGDSGNGTAEEQHGKDGDTGTHPGVAGCLGVAADDLDLIPPDGAFHEQIEQQRAEQGKKESAVQPGIEKISEPRRVGELRGQGKIEPLRITPGTIDEIIDQ